MQRAPRPRVDEERTVWSLGCRDRGRDVLAGRRAANGRWHGRRAWPRRRATALSAGNLLEIAGLARMWWRWRGGTLAKTGLGLGAARRPAPRAPEDSRDGFVPAPRQSSNGPAIKRTVRASTASVVPRTERRHPSRVCSRSDRATEASRSGSPVGASKRNEKGGVAATPSAAVRSETGAMEVGRSKVSTAGSPTLGAGDSARSAATDPSRRGRPAMAGPRLSTTGSRWMRRGPSGPGATNRAEPPRIRSRGISDGRPLHARAVAFGP